MTVPLVVIVALLLGGSGSGDGSQSPGSSSAVLPAVSVPAPSATDDRTVSTCARVISALPLRLAGQDLRRTESTPASASIVAWGDPAIVLRCGVGRPAGLRPGSSRFVVGVNGVQFLPDKQADGTRFTVVDRAVYLDVTVPSSYPQPPLGPIADAITTVLPEPVCVVDPARPLDQQCTRRR